MDAIVLLHAGHWLPTLLATLVPLVLVAGLLVVLSRGTRRRG